MTTTKPTRSLINAFLAAAMLFALPARPAAAQEAPEAKTAPGLQTFDLLFPGGTLDEFVNDVKRAAGTVNIVVDPDAKDILVAQFEVKNVSVPTALELVGAVLRSPNVRVAPEMIFKGGGAPVYAVHAVRSSLVNVSGARGGAEETVYRVISIQEVVAPLGGGRDGLRPEAVLSAIDAAIGVAGGSGEIPVIKYHPETGILIVKGTVDQTRLVEEVVLNIRNDRRGRAPGAKVATGDEKATADLEKQLVDAKNEITRLRTAILSGEEYDVDGDGVITDRERKATRR